METFDKNYLILQFKYKIHSKNGTEFQSFFEDMMEKLFLDFKKVPSGGGDGGNDGWIKELGRYYQVYAPNTPDTKDSDAAIKLEEDFNSIKENWNEISKVKEYYFVFNDKYRGSKKPEEVIGRLEKENRDIKFYILLAKDLQRMFFELNQSDKLELGFDIDSRKAVSTVYEYLKKVEIALDRGNGQLALNILESTTEIVSNLNDDKLSLEYEILECKCFNNLERVDEAKERYENISKRFPYDPRAFLYLAEIYLNLKEYQKNEKLLEKARSIDSDYWLLKLEELLRKNHFREKINLESLDEEEFPDDKKIKVAFYRLYVLLLANSGDITRADSFIEKALRLNPDQLNNYIVKLSLLESKMFSNHDTVQKLQESQKLLEEIEKVEKKFFEFGEMRARNKVTLNKIRLTALRVQENYLECGKIAYESLKLATTCYFDRNIDESVSNLLEFISLNEGDFNRLLDYFKKSKKEISDDLSTKIICIFNINESLFSEGKKFFKESNNQKYFDFINDLENQKHESVLLFLNDNVQFAVVIVNTLKGQHELKRKIIKNLPEKEKYIKKILLALVSSEEGKFDEAFEILNEVGLEKIKYLDCKLALKIVKKRKAWDSEIIVLGKLLEKEKDRKAILDLKVELFNVYIMLKKYQDAINVGEKLLECDLNEKFLTLQGREMILNNTLVACFERGKFDENALEKSKTILKKYNSDEFSFEFKTSVEVETYIRDNEVEKALKSIIDGIKKKKGLLPKEYANLYFNLSLRIGKQSKLNLESLTEVVENTFVKFKNNEQWYFLGDDNELETVKLDKDSEGYFRFLAKKVGDEIVFAPKYSSSKNKQVIEHIFSIEKYVLWKCLQNFQKLASEGFLEGVHMIGMPEKDDTIDPQNLLNFLEDSNKKSKEFFEIYCQDNLPMAILSFTEGGILEAIGRIHHENKGFIRFSTGTPDDFEKQKSIALDVIDRKKAFYIDGTSALILAEAGVLKKIYEYLPNLKIPQSVINLLGNISGKIGYTSGQMGHLGYAQGKIVFSSVDPEAREKLRAKLSESIKLFETKSENISDISLANKMDYSSEQKIHPELCDACILAQKEDALILTEDFLYLQMNALETKKKAPEYFSSIVLVKVLYEKGKISFDEYLNFFGYLSSYRFRFLSLDSEDIEKAVFGDGKIKAVRPENIRKLNFPLTLSEEYGVQFQNAFSIVGRFFLKVLKEHEVADEVLEKIFVEIIESFPINPEKVTKKYLVLMLLGACYKQIENDKSTTISTAEKQIILGKIMKLAQLHSYK